MLQKLTNNHLLPFFELLRKKQETFDPINFQTYNYELELEIQKRVDSVQLEDINRLDVKNFIDEFKSLDFRNFLVEIEKIIEHRKKSFIQKDKRVELFIQLIEEAEKTTPLISFVILHRRHFPIQMENLAKASVLILECEELEGEAKAEKAADAYHDVAERLYDNYVRILWELCCIIRGKKEFKSKNTFGGTINDLKENLPQKYHELIDFDAGWYRNTTAHKSRRYFPAEQVLLLTGKIRGIQYEETICANCLEAMAKDIYWMSGQVLLEVSSIYLIKNVLLDSELVKVGLDLLKKIDIEKLDEIDFEYYNERLKNRFKNLEGYKILRV